MSLLEGKTALIFGVANKNSIAWGMAKAMHDHGAKVALSYSVEALEKRVRPLAETIGSNFVEVCDVTIDSDIEAVFEKASSELGTIDILVHAIAFANREDLEGEFYKTSRDGFKLAMEVSVYSFVALARAARPLMPDGGSMMTLTYYGSQKVTGNYNVMGVAKAGLESTTRYLARDFGPDGIRVNAISAGPIKTLSASGVKDFKKLYAYFAENTPLKRNITAEDVGNTGVWLGSDLSQVVTGEVVYVDSGYNILGTPLLEANFPS